MRSALVIIVLLAAAVAGLGWHNQRRLTALRTEHEALVAHATARGISPESQHPAKTFRDTEIPTEPRPGETEDTINLLLTAYRDLDAGVDPKPKHDQKWPQPPIAVTHLLMSLQGEQLMLFIEKLQASEDLLNWRRETLLKFAVGRLAEDLPREALWLLTGDPEAREIVTRGQSAMSSPIYAAMDRWATTDFPAALEWFRSTHDTRPDFKKPALASLLCQAAERDPQLALSLTNEFEVEPKYWVRLLTEGPRTLDQRPAVLAMLREAHSTVFQVELLDDAVGKLVTGYPYSIGFRRSSQLIDASDLSPRELALIARHLENSRSADPRWIDFMTEKLPPGEARSLTWSLVPKWIRRDWQAAGDWLDTAPDGPEKNAAIKDLAKTAFIDDPETAIAWTLRLPAGPDRQNTLQLLHRNWPKSDPASREAAEAFAREHGIEK